MRKLFIIVITICSLITFSSCELDSNKKTDTPTEVLKEKYDISFNTFNITNTPNIINDVTCIPANLPNLKVEGYVFLGWFYDENFTKRAFVADIISSDITLYAKFEKDNTSETIPNDTPSEEPTPGPVVNPTGKLTSMKTCNHNFVNNECGYCHTEYDSTVYSFFNENAIIYNNDIPNPYNINLDDYGSDIKVIFYEADTRRDIYNNVDKTNFYNNYYEAKSYEEAYYRTQHRLMSGDISDQSHLTPDGDILSGTATVRCSTSIYILDYQGKYLGYIPNSFDDDNYIIWYGGAYISHNDVAAYLYAFGEVPVNNKYDKNDGKSTSVNQWGKYGRVNYGSFSANSTKYKYQPKMPNSTGQKYTETDFGTLGNYKTGDRNQSIYNNGKSINRGAARFVFVNNKKNVDERYVFYTYNHYNDFQEYLNYEDGFSIRFGNESAGNQYCYNASDYVEGKDNSPTQRPEITVMKFLDIFNLL